MYRANAVKKDEIKNFAQEGKSDDLLNPPTFFSSSKKRIINWKILAIENAVPRLATPQ